MMSAWSWPGGAWKKKKVEKRTLVAHPRQPLDRRDDRGDILLPPAGGDRGGAELLGEAREGQRHPEATALLEHQIEILQEQLGLHLGLEPPLDHERSADLEHARGGGALPEDVEESRGVEAALGSEHERLGDGSRVEAREEIRGELGETGVADRADMHEALGDRLEHRTAALGERGVAADEDRAVALGHHRRRAAHRRVEEADAAGGGRLAERTRERRRDGA